ncbi:MAG: hypothetical protein Ct9H90mP30_6960 [Actinomycetota bacterium]|nr:MAG: hypothetical protein Ct9H90mP30_6960 [Actinomycetota bacterium]
MLDIAMALRLKGIASNEHIAEITGKGQAEVDDVLNMMEEKSYAQETPRGLRLLPEGKEWTDALLDEERAGIDSAKAEEIYEDFCSQNDSFKQLVTDWQIKIIDGEQQLNDHTDEGYDQQIIDRLVELDQIVAPIFQGAATWHHDCNAILQDFQMLYLNSSQGTIPSWQLL